MTVTIEELGLSRRCRNSLRRAGIDTLGQLMGCSAQDLLGIRMFGTGLLAEVRAALAFRDAALALKEDEQVAADATAADATMRARTATRLIGQHEARIAQLSAIRKTAVGEMTQHMTYRQIAAELGISAARVTMILGRGWKVAK